MAYNAVWHNNHRPWENSMSIKGYIPTNSDAFPQNYEERCEFYLDVSKVMRDIRTRVPIDLIVHTKPMHQAHTKPMHQKFIERRSIFLRKFCRRGKSFMRPITQEWFDRTVENACRRLCIFAKDIDQQITSHLQ